MIAQRHLNLSISQRTVLVTTDMVRAALGIDADSVYSRVDNGDIRWVFNISTKLEIRELRFWAKEIIAPDFCAALTLDKAIAEILGENRLRWRGTEIQHLLLVSRPTIKKLHDEGELPGAQVDGTFIFERRHVEQFLKARCATQFHPTHAEARDNSRGKSGDVAKAISQSPKKALSQILNKVAASDDSPSTKSATHIPASPSTTMQNRKSGTFPAPASMTGAGNFKK